MNEAEKKLVWIGKMNKRSGNDISITVNLESTGRRGRYVGFTFRDDCEKQFCKGGKYFEVAFFKNKMFFKKSDERNGLLIADNPQTQNKYAKIQNETAEYFAHWEGSYALQYDEFWELYYIERKDEN